MTDDDQEDYVWHVISFDKLKIVMFYNNAQISG